MWTLGRGAGHLAGTQRARGSGSRARRRVGGQCRRLSPVGPLGAMPWKQLEAAVGTEEWRARDRSPHCPGHVTLCQGLRKELGWAGLGGRGRSAATGDLAATGGRTRAGPATRQCWALPQSPVVFSGPGSRDLVTPYLCTHTPSPPDVVGEHGGGTSRPPWPEHWAPTLFPAHHLEESGPPACTSVAPSDSEPPVGCP